MTISQDEQLGFELNGVPSKVIRAVRMGILDKGAIRLHVASVMQWRKDAAIPPLARPESKPYTKRISIFL